jgi:hypothetical protein
MILRNGRCFGATIFVSLLFCFALSDISAQEQGTAVLRREIGLAKLQSMAGKLRLGMSRREVERLLGKPAYCPSAGSCNYTVDAEDEQGTPFGLVVRYIRLAHKEGEQEKQTGKLEEYWVGRIAE